jgi:hypothetical protein
MEKIITIGKFAYHPSTRRANTLTVHISLDEKIVGKPVFSGSCNLWNCRNTDIIFGGQSFDSCLVIFPELNENELFMKIYRLWKKHHLNDMDASANDAQREAADEYLKDHKYDYSRVCDFLKEKNLFEVEVDGRKCKYGHEWYYRSIPEDDLNEIKSIFN